MLQLPCLPCLQSTRKRISITRTCMHANIQARTHTRRECPPTLRQDVDNSALQTLGSSPIQHPTASRTRDVASSRQCECAHCTGQGLHSAKNRGPQPFSTLNPKVSSSTGLNAPTSRVSGGQRNIGHRNIGTLNAQHAAVASAVNDVDHTPTRHPGPGLRHPTPDIRAPTSTSTAPRTVNIRTLFVLELFVS